MIAGWVWRVTLWPGPGDVQAVRKGQESVWAPRLRSRMGRCPGTGTSEMSLRPGGYSGTVGRVVNKHAHRTCSIYNGARPCRGEDWQPSIRNTHTSIYRRDETGKPLCEGTVVRAKRTAEERGSTQSRNVARQEDCARLLCLAGTVTYRQ